MIAIIPVTKPNRPNLLKERFIMLTIINVYEIAQLNIRAPLYRSTILLAVINDMIYRPRKGSYYENKSNHRNHYRFNATFQTMFDPLMIDAKIRPLQGRECHAGTFIYQNSTPPGSHQTVFFGFIGSIVMNQKQKTRNPCSIVNFMEHFSLYQGI